MKIMTSNNTVLFSLQILASVFAGFFVYYSITDADIFWHLAAGREIVAHTAIPYTDPFSFTIPPNRTWIDLHWFFQTVMYLVYHAAGMAGLLIVKSVTVAAATWLLLSSFSRNRSTIVMAIVFALTIYGQRYLVPLRPTIMTLLATGAYIALLERYCSSGKLRFCVFLVAVQIVWVNSQGLYLMGPAIAAVYAAGEWINRRLAAWRSSWFEYRPVIGQRELLILAGLPIVLVAFSLVNPYGSNAITFSFKLFHRITPSVSNVYSTMIPENMPLFAMTGTRFSQYPFIVGTLVVLFIIISFAARRHIRFAHWGLAAMGLVLAVMAQRNGIIFTFLVFPAILHAAAHLRFSGRRLATIVHYAVSILAVAGLLFAFVRHVSFLHTWPHTVSPFSHPVGIAEHLDKHPYAGNLFNADRYGGYLLWKLFPKYKVFSDTRWTLRPDANFREYMDIMADPILFDGHAQQWNISRVALPLGPVLLYTPLAKHLYNDRIWKLVYTDGVEVLFSTRWTDSLPALNMNSAATIDRIVTSLKSRFSSSPSVTEEAIYRLSQWCAYTESFAGAEKALSYCTGSNAAIMKAVIKVQQGFYDEAEKILIGEVTAHPSDKQIHMMLIRFYINNGHIDKALNNLSLLLKKNPFYGPGRKLLSTLSKKAEGTS